ncbi:MAG: IS110 family transposase [Rheinheimera sp.]|nr:IS110 family transposase [Rheinheimera sp.]MDZ7871114.1 IS110 family transposase [Rheinheimera sp.]
MNSSKFGVDIAKDVFQVHFVDETSGKIHSEQVKRAHFLAMFVNQKPSLIAMEACSGSHHWARELGKMGHEVRLIAGHKVKPFVTGNKNDALDAKAIWTAMQQPGMRFVAVKTEAQQAVLALHRMRELQVKFRTAQINAVRGLVSEFGEVMGKSRAAFAAEIGAVLAKLSAKVPAQLIDSLRSRVAEIAQLDGGIKELERQIRQWFSESPDSKRLEKIPGVGVLTATALVASIGEVKQFKSGRELAAWLGLVPKQTGSGGKVKLHGISKRGDTYLRTLLIHGARAVLTHQKNPSEWLTNLRCRRPMNVVLVAQANKTARVVWALLAHQSDYQAPLNA